MHIQHLDRWGAGLAVATSAALKGAFPKDRRRA